MNSLRLTYHSLFGAALILATLANRTAVAADARSFWSQLQAAGIRLPFSTDAKGESRNLTARPASSAPMPSRAEKTSANVTNGDPTRPSDELRALLAAEESDKDTTKGSPQAAMPPVKLVAKIVGRTAEPSATVLIGDEKSGKRVSVRVGREYLLTGEGARPLTMLVRGITDEGVDVEIRPIGRRLTLP